MLVGGVVLATVGLVTTVGVLATDVSTGYLVLTLSALGGGAALIYFGL